jgi:hypothetical protein
MTVMGLTHNRQVMTGSTVICIHLGYISSCSLGTCKNNKKTAGGVKMTKQLPYGMTLLRKGVSIAPHRNLIFILGYFKLKLHIIANV